MSGSRLRLPYGAAALCGIVALGLTTARAAVPVGAGSGSTPRGYGANVKPVTSPMRLTYQYRVGDVRRYKVLGLFTGHFPPFAKAGSPPIHLMTLLDYAATVKKVSEKGADVEFNVENATLGVLEKEPGADGKVDPSSVAEYPIGLAQVQKIFNATATFRPNGAIVSIKGGDASNLKIDLGIDLRKLFLVTAPVIFADKPVKSGEEWTFDDGLLGSKPGKTVYTGHLLSLSAAGASVTAIVSQQAASFVDSKLDKEGNSTDKVADVVGSLVGKVSLSATSHLVGSADPAPNGPGVGGRMESSHMALTANLKRTLPDPEQPGKQEITDIDITARLTVTPFTPPLKHAPAIKHGAVAPKDRVGATAKSSESSK